LVFASLDRAIDVMFGSFNFASGPWDLFAYQIRSF
jgi:hypothetical protein